jgi:hypothetical protein
MEMFKNRSWLLGAVLGLSVLMLTAPASAWEFTMTGNFEWTYLYHSQAGHNGFFGPHESGAGIANAGNWRALNFWSGARLISGTSLGLVTGLDASAQYQKMILNPEIRVNPAVRIRGVYWIGGFQTYNGGAAGFSGTGSTGAVLGTNTDLGSSYYLNQQTGSALTRPLSLGQWDQLWVTAQTPWGILAFGKRPSQFGMSSFREGQRHVASESLAIVAPYGPLRIGIGFHPWRQLTLNSRDVDISSAGVNQNGLFIATGGTPAYPKIWDKDALRNPDASWFVTYSNGPLDAGILYRYIGGGHQGPQAQGTIALQAALPTYDNAVEDAEAYFKYNNGRFFLNAEVDLLRFYVTLQQGRIPVVDAPPAGYAGLAGSTGSIYAPKYNESWRFTAEGGFLCGPAKVTLLYSWVPGPDRRGGAWIDRQSWDVSAFTNVPIFMPYSYLMVYTYAGGTNYRNPWGEGALEDASSFGARLDYAVAANLNAFGTFFYADRVSGGWPWGCLTINQGAAAAVGGNNTVNVFGLDAAYPAASAGSPNIPDSALGWEADSGLDWKLLEGLTLNMRVAYWQPGNWFKFACIDKNLATAVDASGRLVPTPANGAAIGSGWSVNPGKSIDPIWAFTSSLNFDF